ncbi:SET domain-containing protein [Benzoatithermus flavus]|uniref:SET domain-containing protein-lysine N-methyltransferase n=1 Tax=Benzoatithermus flavus TaxID=3108223 RepID=A0ABU8XTL2_9PROT
MRKLKTVPPIDIDYIYRKISKCRYIYIGETEGCGLGIFAARGFPEGSALVVDEDGDYYEPSFTYAQVMSFGLDLATHCFQIDTDRYLLPHGSIDDLINHACEPSAGIRLTARGYRLIALKDVEPGEQLTYDYSTYITNPRERLRCACGSPRCRGEIGPFRELPASLRAFYLERGVVGPFAAADAAQMHGGASLRVVVPQGRRMG